ncbi:hypothetical protein [Altererythrobacter sp. Root672]|uniref:hypothetical protein n=1 Tax=Altererythrobacter sp. Root672 TaxID=1736584 RepID=UPI0006F72102|nr:hypothetical protein [Altererythrobacter sp. Root672]KRA84014.1 hypothetical protein ASD76_08420 [Altererythrobacter sp. Root672]
MIRSARWIELVACPGRERDVAAFLIDALPVAQRDEGVRCWFGIRLDHSTFAIFYAFDSGEVGEAQFSAAFAEVLKDRSGSLLSQEPKIRSADVLAAKLREGD